MKDAFFIEAIRFKHSENHDFWLQNHESAAMTNHDSWWKTRFYEKMKSLTVHLNSNSNHTAGLVSDQAEFLKGLTVGTQGK